jgi:hypothetical protein
VRSTPSRTPSTAIAVEAVEKRLYGDDAQHDDDGRSGPCAGQADDDRRDEEEDPELRHGIAAFLALGVAFQGDTPVR